MMRNLTILVDVDGVLADLVGATIAEANFLTSLDRKPSEQTSWEILNLYSKEHHDRIISETFHKPGFCRQLPVMLGAQAFIRELRTLGSVYIVTAPWPVAHWMWERTEWLMEHFGFAPSEIMQVPTGLKPLVRGDVFIDDKPETVVEWENLNRGAGILVDAPYNQKADVRVRAHDWFDVLDIVRKCHAAVS
jgi:5'(3')-deoxyribonucleotidase